MARLLSLTAATIALALVYPRTTSQDVVMAGARIFYGPSVETAQADLAAIGAARKSIDLAAFILTDRDVIAALQNAAGRGVAIRIYLDRDEMARAPARAVDDLAALGAMKGVTLRYKARHSDSMHLKSFAIDRRLVRTGSANFSYSGEHVQDNDVTLLDSPALAIAFTRAFEKMWSRPDNEDYAR